MEKRAVSVNRQAYEGSWGVIAQRLEERLSDPSASVADALAELELAFSDAKVATDAYRVFCGPFSEAVGGIGKAPGRMIASHGSYQIVPPGLANHTMAHLLAERMPEHAATIVEFGSGVGQNLVQLALLTGRKDRRYVACELTDAGRRVTDRLAALLPDYRIETQPFDYTDRDFSFLDPAENVLAFSRFSMEQVTDLEPEFFTELMRQCGTVSGVHLEPCGWQRFSELRSWYDQHLAQGTKPAHSFAATQEEFSRNAAFWAIQHLYNRNLWETVSGLKAAGAIELVELLPDYFGVNPFHPGSLIHWRKPL